MLNLPMYNSYKIVKLTKTILNAQINALAHTAYMEKDPIANKLYLFEQAWDQKVLQWHYLK